MSPFKGNYETLFFVASLGPLLLADLLYVIVLVGLLVFKKVSPYQRLRKEQKHKDVPLSGVDPDLFPEDDELDYLGLDGNNQRKRGNLLANSIWWLIVINFAYFLFSLVAFNTIPIGLGIPMLTIYFWTWWLYILPSPKRRGLMADSIFEEKMYGPGKIQQFLDRTKERIKQHRKRFFGGLLFWFLVTFIICFFTQGVCVSMDPVRVSTKFTRSMDRQFCDKDGVCHVYVTMSEDPSTSMIINFHTKESPSSSHSSDEALIYFDTISHEHLGAYKNRFNGFSWKYTSCDGHSRGIHWIELKGLSPNTTYYFRVGFGPSEARFSEEKRFTTLPASGPVSFVTGGDLGISEETRRMMILAGKQNPQFALIGGDIAYANAMETCYHLWDYFVQYWEDYMITPSGDMIPMILAIGNHEAGGFDQKTKNVPFFMNWFPQELNVARENRNTFHTHFISDYGTLLALDSDITTNSHGDVQINWIKEQFNRPQATNRTARLALYHVPLYPVYRSPDSYPSKDLRSDWLSVFDDVKLSIAFENHDHAYKRTFPIKNDKIVEPNGADNRDGTVFMGDGAWGVPPRNGLKSRWYLAQASARNFVLRVDMNRTAITVRPFDIEGVFFDEFTKQL